MPCSPGMTACKASCAHRAFVEGYREERARQMFDVVEGQLGYATEISDEIRRRAEMGQPVITFQQYMIQSKVPPEAREMTDIQFDRSAPPSGNQFAEESLLAVAMFNPRAVEVLRQLDPNEFQSPLTNEVAKAIITLEGEGTRADAVAVEDYLRTRTEIVRDPAWDSTFAWAAEDITDNGLQKWEKTAGVYENATYFADEIRQQHIATGTHQAYTWGADMIERGYSSSEGVSLRYTQLVQQEVGKKVAALPPPLPAVGLAPPAKVNALNYTAKTVDDQALGMSKQRHLASR